MKKISALLFLFFLICISAVNAQTHDENRATNTDEMEFSARDSARYKKAVAEVMKPDYRKYTTGNGRHSTTHYIAYVGFLAKDVEVRDEVEDVFLYFKTSRGDRFTVLYDSIEPHHFRILTSEPKLDAYSRTDTITGTVCAIESWGTSLRFSYTVNNTDSIKTQDIVEDDFLYNKHPDIIKGRKFLVAYNTRNPGKAILLQECPADTGTFHFEPHNNLIGLTAIPLSKMAITYERIAWKKFAIGVTATVYYDPLHEANFFANAGKRTDGSYTDSYFQFKNAASFSPHVKWYVCNNAPLGLYLKMQGSFLSTQVKTNYFNVSGMPKDTTAISFLAMDPSNKTETAYKTVNAFGIQSGAGCSFFMGNSYRWAADIGLGFQYYFYPDHLKTAKMIDATAYYYHDAPAWDNFFNFPMYFEMSVYRKF